MDSGCVRGRLPPCGLARVSPAPDRAPPRFALSRGGRWCGGQGRARGRGGQLAARTRPPGRGGHAADRHRRDGVVHRRPPAPLLFPGFPAGRRWRRRRRQPRPRSRGPLRRCPRRPPRRRLCARPGPRWPGGRALGGPAAGAERRRPQPRRARVRAVLPPRLRRGHGVSPRRRDAAGGRGESPFPPAAAGPYAVVGGHRRLPAAARSPALEGVLLPPRVQPLRVLPRLAPAA